MLPIAKLANYYSEMLKILRRRTLSYLVNITEGRTHEYIDMSHLTETELLLTREDAQFVVKKPPPTFDDSAVKNTAFLRLRELELKYKSKPYEKEFLYAYPFLVGKIKDGKVICAPLLISKCTVDSNYETGAITVRLISEIQINTIGLTEIMETETFKTFKDCVLKKDSILQHPLEKKQLQQLFAQLSNIEPQTFTPANEWDWRLKNIESPRSQNGIEIKPFAAIILVGHGYYYIRDDLDKLKAATDDPSQSVLSVLFEDSTSVPSEDTDRHSKTDEEELIFPFEANYEQKSVAWAAAQSRLVAVEGPPGTGKSQTIANLICHFVSKGNTVLFTSQKNKALEVVTEKWLKRLNISYLYMRLLKSDDESKRELINKLDSIGAFYPSLFDNFSEESIKLIESNLQEIRKRYKDLEKKFETARETLNQNFSKYRRYDEIRNFDIIPHQIELPAIDDQRLTAMIEDYVKLYLSPPQDYGSQTWYDTLSRWSGEIPNLVASPEEIKKLMLELARHMEQIVPLKSDRSILNLRQSLMPINEHLIRNIPRAIDWLNQLESEIPEYLIKRADVFAHCRDEKELEEIIKIGSWSQGSRGHVDYGIIELSENLQQMLNNFPAKWYQPIRLFKFKYHQRKFNSTYLKIPPSLRSYQKIEPLAGTEQMHHYQEELEIIRLKWSFAKLHKSISDRFIQQPVPILDFARLPKNIAEARNFIQKARDTLKLIELEQEVRNIQSELGIVMEDLGIPQPIVDGSEQELNGIAGKIRNLAFTIPNFAKLKKIEQALGPGLSKWIRDYCESQGTPDRETIEKAIEAHRLRRTLEEPDDLDTNRIAEELTQLRRKEKEKIKELLKVKISRNLYLNPELRRTIIKLTKLLKKSKKSFFSIETLKEEVDFPSVLKVLPCWVMSIDDVCRLFPLEPGLFDILIVDEASQCHLMNSLPLLYRAKKALIVGDSKQLPSAELMFLDTGINEELKRKTGVAGISNSIFFDVAENSLMDLANAFADRRIYLKEHYRALPEIIDFCNRNFYDMRLEIMTHNLNLPPDGIFEIIEVDACEDTDRKINEQEAEKLIQDLFQRVRNEKYRNLSFGILSPFREQADLLESLLSQYLLNEPDLQNHLPKDEPLIAGTFDAFQGDERDVIFYSFRYAPNSSPNIFAIELGRDQMGEKRMNVAFSRARKKVICYISQPIEKFPDDSLIRKFLEHARAITNRALNNQSAMQNPDCEKCTKCESEFERDVCTKLRKLGYYVIPQYPFHRFRIDLVVGDGTGRYLAVECDGMFHYDSTGELRISDLQRQEILERAGWHIFRIPARDYYRNPNLWIDRVLQKFSNLRHQQ